MATFEFYAMSEEDQADLRGNQRRCVALLRPCKPLADRLAQEGGIYALLSVDDERLLQAFHLRGGNTHVHEVCSQRASSVSR